MAQTPHMNYSPVRNYDQDVHCTICNVSGGHVQYARLNRREDGTNSWLYGPADDRSVPHRHDFFELVIVRSGTLTQYLERSALQYQAGDALLLNCGVTHCEGMSTDCEVLFIQMKPPVLERAFTADPFFVGQRQYAPRGIPDFVRTNGRREDVREYLDFAYAMERRERGEPSPLLPLQEQLFEAILGQEPGYAYQALALLLRMFACLEDPAWYHLSHIRADASAEELLYARIYAYLAERQGRATRAELGRAMHYNGDYLSRVVKQTCGKTLLQLGQEIRIDAAAQLLRQTDLPVGEVIGRLGFSSPTYFHRLFRAQLGCTPLEYRKSGRKQA